MMLGLAPSTHLSQTKTPTLLQQLVEKKIIERGIFSVMLINGQEGVLSVGGTGAEAVDLVEAQTRRQLDQIGALEMTTTGTGQTASTILKRATESDMTAVQDPTPDWRSGWKWSKVQGAEGWWQVLMQGVWVDGSKVLKNQPVVIDVRLPPPPSSPLPPSHLPLYYRQPANTSTAAKHPLHTRPPPRRPRLLRLHLRLPAPPRPSLPLPRLPLPQPPRPALRVRRLALSRYAGRPRQRVARRAGWEVQSG